MFVILLCISVVLKSAHLFSPAVCFDFVCNLLKVTAQFFVVWFIISMTEIKLTPDLHVKWTSHQLHLTDTNLVSDQRHRVLKITVTTASINLHTQWKLSATIKTCLFSSANWIYWEGIARFLLNQSFQDISRQTACLTAKEFHHIFIVDENMTWHKLQSLGRIFYDDCIHLHNRSLTWITSAKFTSTLTRVSYFTLFLVSMVTKNINFMNF